MPSIRLSGVGYAHDDAVPLFAGLDLHLAAPGWVGVVGPNGAGKTTLLRVLSRALRPHAGALVFEPRDARVLLCAQEPADLAPEIAAFGDAADAAARRLHGRLALDPGALARWPSLSPGERRRWQIGAALASEPDVLLLDEPTNHLDGEARALLLAALARFRGVGVVVSHDRALLDALARGTLRLERGRARLWPGGYSAARDAWEAAAHAERDAHERARAEQARTAQRLADARRTLDAAEASRSSRARMKDRHDHDARGALAKGQAAFAEARIGRTAAVLRRKLARDEATASAFALEKDKGRAVFVGYARAPGARLCELDAPRGLLAGDAATELLAGPLRLALGRDDRVRVAGPNGAGKTTLVRALLAGARVPRERLLYVPQEIARGDTAAHLEAVRRELAPEARARVLSLFAALGADPDRLLRSGAPSPGEARKLAIALGLGRHAWGVVLDEPSNHLDLPSVERLEQALRAYPGALLLVTHDEAFARACGAHTTWRLGGSAIAIETS